jgi:hypothetical protein
LALTGDYTNYCRSLPGWVGGEIAIFRQQQRRKRPGLRVSSYDSGF